ncbi:MAG: hypothetical protein ACU837_15980 [Gammaproteobacteria bacterium]
MLNKNNFKNKRLIEEIVLAIILILSLIGIGITDISPLESHRYWTFMIFLLAFASIGLGWSKKEYQGKIFKDLVVHQLIHWGATLIAVSGIYLLLQTGRLNYESAGLVIEIILGFSLFLDGRNLGWRYSLLGILVGITAIVAAYVEEFIWIIYVITLFIVVAAYYWEKHRRKNLFNNTSEAADSSQD